MMCIERPFCKLPRDGPHSLQLWPRTFQLAAAWSQDNGSAANMALSNNRGRVAEQLYPVLPSALDGVDRQRHAAAALWA
jgi:hypothetical protein